MLADIRAMSGGPDPEGGDIWLHETVRGDGSVDMLRSAVNRNFQIFLRENQASLECGSRGGLDLKANLLSCYQRDLS